jgi:hypothetical protein
LTEPEAIARDPNYYPNMTVTLKAAAGESITPALGTMDQVILSLEVK